MDNVVSLINRKKIKALTKNIAEMEELSKLLKSNIQSLTKFEGYSSVKRNIENMFVLYQDIKRARQTKLDLLQRLKNE